MSLSYEEEDWDDSGGQSAEIITDEEQSAKAFDDEEQPNEAADDQEQPNKAIDDDEQHDEGSYVTPTTDYRYALVSIDDELLTGFHPETVQLLGDSHAPGLRCIVQTASGSSIPQTVTLIFQMRSTKDEMVTFARAVVKVDSSNPVCYKVIEESDITDGYLPSSNQAHSEFSTSTNTWGNKIQKDFYKKYERQAKKLKKSRQDLTPRECAAAREQGIVSVEIKFESSQVHVAKSSQFWKFGTHTSLVNTITQDAMPKIEAMKKAKSVKVVMWHKGDSDTMWDPLTSTEIIKDPYTKSRSQCRERNLIDLDFGNITPLDDVFPERKLPASTAFVDNDHRTTSLAYSEFDQDQHHQKTIADSGETMLSAVAIAIPGSEWTTSQGRSHGIDPKGFATAFLLVVAREDTNSISDISPDVHEKATAKLYANIETCPCPTDVELSEEEHLAIGKMIVELVTDAQDRLDNFACCLPQSVSDDDELLQQELNEHLENSFMNDLRDFIRDRTPREENESDQSLNDRLGTKAVEFGLKCRRCLVRESPDPQAPSRLETPQEHVQRIVGYSKALAYLGPQSSVKQDLDSVFNCRRLPDPIGLAEDVAVFILTAPKQTVWPSHLEAPPVQLQTLSSTKVNGDTIHDVLKAALSESKARFSVRLYRALDSTTTFTTLRALYKLNEHPPQWWPYYLSFDPATRPASVDLIERFPSLNTLLENPTTRQEQRQAVQDMKEAPAGHVLFKAPLVLAKPPMRCKWPRAFSIPHKTNRAQKSKRIVVFVYPKNQQCDDTAGKLKSLGRKVYRYHGMDKELGNLLSPTTTAPVSFVADNVPKAEASITQYANKSMLESHQHRSVAENPHAISEQARYVVKKDGDRKYDTIKTAWQAQSTGSTEEQHDKTKARATARDLVKQLVDEADVVVVTPVACADLAGQMSSLTPDMIFVDEAGALSECASLVPLAHWPSAPIMFVGDPVQGGPFSAVGHPNYLGHFPNQYTQSLLDRASKQDGPVSYFTENRRALGGVARLPQRLGYGHLMALSRDTKPEQITLRQWLHKKFKTDEPMIWLSHEFAEAGLGTSFRNHKSAEFCMKLAEDALKEHPELTILIITPYKSQKHLFDSLKIDHLHNSNLDIRTIDDSPSFDADFVIVNNVRSSSAGFTIEKSRIMVALTRAKFATVIVSNKAPYSEPKAGLGFQLLSALEDRKAIWNICSKTDPAQPKPEAASTFADGGPDTTGQSTVQPELKTSDAAAGWGSETTRQPQPPNLGRSGSKFKGRYKSARPSRQDVASREKEITPIEENSEVVEDVTGGTEAAAPSW